MGDERASLTERRTARARWTETALCLLIALALAAGSQLVANRAGDGLERYRVDQIAGRVAVGAEPMLDAYCREIGSAADTAACPRASAAAPRTEPSPAAFDAFAQRLLARHHLFDGALGALDRDGVDWRLVSEGFAAEAEDARVQGRLQRAWAELDREREAAEEAGLLARRLDRGALEQAVALEHGAYAAAARRGDRAAASDALLRLTRILDGQGSAPAAGTVARLLDAGRIAERARQAEVLVRHGWILWSAWIAWLWLATRLGRRRVRPLSATALLLAVALAVAGAEQRWLDLRLPEPAYWGVGLAAAFVLLLDQLAAVRGWAWTQRLPRRVAASPWLLPGWMAFAGIGWLLLADLSLNFHPRLRFLLVDHFVGVWTAVLVLGLLPLLAAPSIRALAGLLGRAGRPTPGGRATGFVLLALLPAAAWVAASDGVALPQHYTGEVFKAVAIVYAAWFLLLRAPLLRAGMLTAETRGMFTAGLPALLVLAAVAAAFGITRDLGPLLVLLLCVLIWSGAFVGWRVMAAGLALALGALFVAGGLFSPIVAERVRSVADPFTSQTDDLARLLWFHQEVPPSGFGLGQVPWCGYGASERCFGLPLQTQSDYTFTALFGVAGDGAWLVVVLMGLWAVTLMRSRWDTAVHPQALLASARAYHEGLRAWLAVTFGTLVLVQLASTVAGNLAWLPLSGITVPFVSFGSAALVTMTAILALLAEKTAPTGETAHA